MKHIKTIISKKNIFTSGELTKEKIQERKEAVQQLAKELGVPVVNIKSSKI